MRVAPSKTVRCEVCGDRLDYQIGSIMWQHQDNDLCPGCAGIKASDEIFERLNGSTPPTARGDTGQGK